MDELSENNFKNLKLKNSYNSDNEDVFRNFYLPVLSNSINYDRIAGFFSSSVLASTARAIKGIIKNDGKIRLIMGVQVNKKDFDTFRQMLSNKVKFTKLFNLKFENFLDEISDFEEDHISVLGWLLWNNKLEIKIGLPLIEIFDEFNYEQYLEGYFHIKNAILYDDFGNIITFNGSINESKQAWKYNAEKFNVFRSWIKGDIDRISTDIKEFEKFWNDKAKKTKIYDLPNAIEKEILSIKTDNIEESLKNIKKWVKKYKKEVKSVKINRLNDQNFKLKVLDHEKTLRKCQKDAIKYLSNRNFKGILSMATGSGKTRAAFFASYELIKSTDTLLIIISVPDAYLVKQWADTLRIYTNNVLEIRSAINWKKRIYNKIRRLTYEKSYSYFIGTNRSLNNDFYEKLLNKYNFSEDNILFIGDEMHSLGSPINQLDLEGFSPKYKIGLSATPFRNFDQKGTNFLFKWFETSKENIFNFTLSDAQSQGYLVKYKYKTKICYLLNKEFKKFVEITETITGLYHQLENAQSPNKKRELSKSLSEHAIKRSKILKKAESKINLLEDLLWELRDDNKLTNLVIYCEDNNQLNRVKEIISRINKKTLDLTFEIFDGTRNLEERKQIIKNSRNQTTGIILAMKCLDQGVDIPTLKRSIFLSSSSNPLQHIQRAGRVLRKTKKPRRNENYYAEIYDILILSTKRQRKISEKASSKINKTELTRAEFFIENSLNKHREKKSLNEYLT